MIVKMQQILIIGAGGHGQVVADILLRAYDAGAQATPIGFLDANPALWGELRLGLPILGGMDQLEHVAHDALILGVGHNGTRRRLFDQYEQRGACFAIACHPTAIVAPDVRIGRGTTICAGAIVSPGSVIGNNAILNTGCTVDHHSRIADHAHVAPGVHLGGDVCIGEGTLLGIGASVMPQRHVGSWSIVGAGALVHTHVADRTTVVGVPARVSKLL